jgi:integrase
MAENIRELRDPKTGEIFWLAKVVGKTKERILELNSLAMRVINPIPAKGLVFPGITEDMIKYYTQKVAKAFGLSRVRFHDFRHNWSDRKAQTSDLGAWMNAGGWKSVQSARGYLSQLRTRRGTAINVDYGIEEVPTNCPLKPQISLEIR